MCGYVRVGEGLRVLIHNISLSYLYIQTFTQFLYFSYTFLFSVKFPFLWIGSFLILQCRGNAGILYTTNNVR